MTALVPGRRYRAGDAEGEWTSYAPPDPYAGCLRLDRGGALPIPRGWEQHLVPIEPTERRVVLTCGRSRFHGVLEDGTLPDLWDIRVDGEPGLRDFDKDVWTLADEPTEPEPPSVVSPEPEPIPDREGVVVLDAVAVPWLRGEHGWRSSGGSGSWTLANLGPVTLLHDPEHPHACRVEPVAVDVDGIARAIVDGYGRNWASMGPLTRDLFRNTARGALIWLAGQGVPVVAKDQP